MILKQYQQRTLDFVKEYLERLAEFRAQAQTLKAQALTADWDFDWPEQAWKKTVPHRPWKGWKNGLGELLPSFCLKIPTGGGKTLLAIKVIDLINLHFRRKQTGVVLWIVPTTQIYEQTLRALGDRNHPYRQHLDMASAGRTLILKKRSRFSPQDVRECLCVLVLMLPSANRETKEQLRVFRDRGGFERFFPAEDNAVAHEELLRRVPNLDTFDIIPGVPGPPKSSLGNVLRLQRPLIILDEGHKAYSSRARETLAGFNPCFVVELSATPPEGANVLVEVPGRELHAEEMIKLDIHIHNSSSPDWKDTLLKAVELRSKLEEEARKHQAATGEYIRPICLIQVERTGKDQRRPGLIHAEDAREYLLAHPAIQPEHVAVKSSHRDELRELADTGGLLHQDCPVRFIITKQALQEGWDCSFAYVLAVLTNPSSKSALTQLVGRILRQPRARKTKIPWLDESYVFSFRRRGDEILREIRKGFDREGLGDLGGRLLVRGDEAPAVKAGTRRPRKKFRQAAHDLVLPAFLIRDMHVERGNWRLVYYEADILSRVPWGDMDIGPLNDLELGDASVGDVDLVAGLEGGAVAAAPDGAYSSARDPEDEIDLYFAARHLLDAVPNPWMGRRYAQRTFEMLLAKYPRQLVVDSYAYILEKLGQRLAAERDRLAEEVFRRLLDEGTMRFLVVAKELRGTRLPRTIAKTRDRPAYRADGEQFRRSLFHPVGESELNDLETKVATYLDQQERLFFWYRNRARKDHFVQGWKRSRIFADFIVTLQPDEPDPDDPYHRVFVLETKGLHLKGAPDTNYKRSVFDLCSEHATQTNWAEFVPAMRGRVIRYEIVDQEEWQQRLAGLVAGSRGEAG